jgi:hypothetical protein
MNLKKKWLVLALLVPTLIQAQGINEYRISLRNGILLNTPYVTTSDGSKGNIKNTFTQGLAFSYTRVTKPGILLSAEAALSYEKYKIDLRDYPFEENLYNHPATLTSEYEQKATIPYAQVNVAVGYRFKQVKKFTPEIRIGEAMSFPLNYKYIGAQPYAKSMLSGFNDPVLRVTGFYGKLGLGIVGDLLTNIYVGCAVPHKIKGLGSLSAGFNVQRKTSLGPLNQYDLKYENAWGSTTYIEKFRGQRLIISLQINVGL